MMDIILLFYGEMAEWLKAYAWKAYVGEISPRVRIPFSPPEGFKGAILTRSPEEE